MIAVAFDRTEKAWMTVGGGGEDERVEWPEIDWSLVDYPLRAANRLPDIREIIPLKYSAL